MEESSWGHVCGDDLQPFDEKIDHSLAAVGCLALGLGDAVFITDFRPETRIIVNLAPGISELTQLKWDFLLGVKDWNCLHDWFSGSVTQRA
jgi:hypothetical protein